MQNFRARTLAGNDRPKIREETTENGEPCALFTSLMTNKDLDSHGTRFSEDSLANFEKAENITLLDSHDYSNTGYGTSTRVWREGDNVYGEFAILKKSKWSSKLTYQDAESLIYDIENRHFDTSVGFNNDTDVCDLCLEGDGKERDIWFDEDCPHLLNQKYDNKLATAEMRGAVLYENSIVFAGSNDTSHIVSAEQREQSVAKCERMLKDGLVSVEGIIGMARSLQIPELRNISKKKQVFIPEKKRGKKMAKTVEGLEARVVELEEQVEETTEAKDEIKELYDKERAKNKELKTKNRELNEQLETLTEIEDTLRDECRKVDKESEKLRKEDDRKSETEAEEFETELKQLSYKRLQTKLKSLKKERDILIEINKVENGGEGEEAKISEGEENDNKPVQPFMARGELDSRFLGR